ncbi:hypothetical protein EZS27_011068 [termite gut metagenome]|uniref:Uncharacterized protein n=1 Tax=termite gut metagenome TaxID=433724 RepID=A0A5J4S4M0_9ZZZZ
MAIGLNEAEQVSYNSLIDKLQKSYALVGFSFETNKTKLLTSVFGKQANDSQRG